MRTPVATLLLLGLLTFVLGLGRQAITDADEAYYAEAAREMVASGDWLTPHFNFTDRWQKPVLYYWAAAATFRVAGTSEWGARGLSALSGLALILLTYRVGRRLLTRDAAWIGAAIVATCYGYFAMARLALPDLPLAFFITCAIALWLEERPLLAGVAAGLGFLDKGPLALLVPALVLVPLAWRERRWPLQGSRVLRPVALSPRALVLGAFACVIVAAPWYIAMTATHGRAYLESFFIGDNLERFATDRFNSPRAVWFYVPIVIGGVFPWTAYLLVLPWRRAFAVLRRRAVLTSEEWRLLVWAAAPLLFFTMSIGKQPRYILPVLPPLALLLGASIAKRLRGRVRAMSDDARSLRLATWITAAIYFLLAALLYRARPILINAAPAGTLAGIAALMAAGLALVITAAAQQWQRLPSVMATAAAALLLTVQFGGLAGNRPEAVERVAQLVAQHRTGGEALGIYQVLTRNLVFYTGVRQEELFNAEQASQFLARPERVLLVVRARDAEQLQSSLTQPLIELGRVAYLDPASIKLGTFLAPDPKDALADVVLVSNR